jgi:hypothetical protein
VKKLSQNQLIECIYLLQGAKQEIAKKTQDKLCVSMYSLVRMDRKNFRLACYLQNWVMSMLQNVKPWHSYTLEQWYQAAHQKKLGTKQARTIRLQWIDWMIEEIRKELA